MVLTCAGSLPSPAAQPPLAGVAADELELDRLGVADDRQISARAERVAIGLDAGRAEADLLAPEDLFVDGLMDAGRVLVAERLDPAGALLHTQRRGVGGQLHARAARVVGDHQRRLPGSDVDEEVVTGLRRRSRSLRPHRERGIVRPKPVSARLERHAPSI